MRGCRPLPPVTHRSRSAREIRLRKSLESKPRAMRWRWARRNFDSAAISGSPEFTARPIAAVAPAPASRRYRTRTHLQGNVQRLAVPPQSRHAYRCASTRTFPEAETRFDRISGLLRDWTSAAARREPWPSPARARASASATPSPKRSVPPAVPVLAAGQSFTLYDAHEGSAEFLAFRRSRCRKRWTPTTWPAWSGPHSRVRVTLASVSKAFQLGLLAGEPGAATGQEP